MGKVPLLQSGQILLKADRAITHLKLSKWTNSFVVDEYKKMVTFINMIITHVKNGSPDMILTPFDGKFHETKM